MKVHWFLCKLPVFCRILTKLEFSRQIFEKYSDNEFHENPSIGKTVVPCRQTEGHDEPNSLLDFKLSPCSVCCMFSSG
jgi:hypothetical protein